MRLKQLVGFLLPLVLISSLAMAATPQLTNVSVVAEGNTTTVTLHASGVYTHNEYRPTDNLLLVDLTGISAGQLHERVRSVKVPGVKSYRVVGFTGAGGVEIARVELTLIAHPSVKITDSKGTVTVQVIPAGSDTAAPAPEKIAAASAVAAPAGAAAQKPAPSLLPVAASMPAKPVEVRKVVVVRGKEGMQLEVTGSGTLTPKVIKLSAPDRVVLDLPNAVPSGRPHDIRVNSGNVKMVRIARYQLDPPVMRLVVDLDAPHDYEVVESGSKLILKLHPAVVAAKTLAPAPAPAKLEAVKASSPQPLEARNLEPEYKGGSADTPSSSAKDFVVVELKPKSETTEAAQPAAIPAPLTVTTSAPLASSALAAPQNPSTVSQTTGSSAPEAAAPVRPVPAINFAAEQQQQAQKPAAPAPRRYTGEPISVNLKDVDLKDFFRLIHEISGLNIVLDPSVSGSLTLVLDDVPWDQALDIVLKNNSLDRQLDGNVLRISTVDNLRKEAQARRLQIEAQALAVDKVTVTRFLSYAHAKNLLPTLKKQLSQRGDVVADDRTNALIISDIPNVIPGIDALLVQLDRKTQQVEIEARVISASRSFLRDIGTQLGFGWGNNATSLGGDAGLAPAPFIIKGPAPTIPLFSNLAATATSGVSLVNLGTKYRFDAFLTAAESRGLVKILSRPRLITQNNIQALVKQGTKVPIVTPGTATTPPTTTYIDATLRMTVTPQITSDGTIFLNVDVENTSPDFSHVDANGAPSLNTQQTTTQVLVTNGGTVVIGGVVSTTNSVNIAQVPLMGNIPILGNLFKHRRVETTTQELIFFITPRIVET